MDNLQSSSTSSADFLNASFASVDSTGSINNPVEKFACSYVLYDKQMGKQNKFHGIIYMGQTTDPNGRIYKHKSDGRMTNATNFLVVTEYQGVDAEKNSLRDEYAFYRIRDNWPEQFKNLEKGAKPGNPDKNGTNARARKESTSGVIKKHVFEELQIAIDDERTWDGRKLFACNHCASTFPTNWTLVRHEQSFHQQEPEHKCPYCPQLFYWERDVARHIRGQHQENERLKCTHPGCDETFTLERNLQTHIRTAHSRDATIYKCRFPNCKMESNKKWNVKRHLKDYHGFEEEVANEANGTTPQRKKRKAEGDMDKADESIGKKHRKSDP